MRQFPNRTAVGGVFRHHFEKELKQAELKAGSLNQIGDGGLPDRVGT